MPGQKVTLSLRPEKLKITAPDSSMSDNTLRGVIREMIFIGTDMRYIVSLVSGETLVVRMQNTGDISTIFVQGDNVKIWYQPAHTHILAEE